MKRMRSALVALVAAGWLFNLVAPAFIQSYDSNLAANAPLMLVLGAIFATRESKEEKDNGH